MSSMPLDLKHLLGVAEYNRLVKTVVYPEIERLAGTGTLSPHDLARLAKHIERDGAAILDVRAEDTGETSKQTLAAGAMVRAKIPLAQDVSIDLFAKRHSDPASYRRGVGIEDVLVKHFRGTPHEHVVPKQVYTNPSTLVSIMPMLQGNVLTDAVHTLDDAGKEALLTRVIDTYISVTHAVEAANLFETKRTMIGRALSDDVELGTLTPFSELFRTLLRPSDKLARVYDKHIAQGMRWGIPGDFIHGDLHTNNVIVGDAVHIIDWEYAKRGFMEFDLYKILAKSGVEGELEYRLVAYAAHRKDTIGDREDGQRIWRYHRNAISQDLFTAVRYLKRADDAPTHKKERLEKMALVSYNNALRRLHTMGSKHTDIVPMPNGQMTRFTSYGDLHLFDVADALEEHVKTAMPRLRRLPDEEFTRLKASYDPHSHVSQENLLTSDADMPRDKTIDAELKDQYLKTIKKNLHKRDWGTILTRALAAGVLVGATFGVNAYMNHVEKQRAEEAARIELGERMYMNSFRASYETLIEAQLNDGIRKGFYAAERTPLKPVDYFGKDNLVKTTCAQHNVPVQLVEGMYSVNAVVAGSHESGADLKGLRLLDPYRQWGSDSLNPETNLKAGVARLSRLFDKYDVDRKKLEQTLREPRYPLRDVQRSLVRALTEFYAAEKGNSHPYPDDIVIPPTVRKIVYNVLHGGPTGDETGTWLEEPPKDFTLK